MDTAPPTTNQRSLLYQLVETKYGESLEEYLLVARKAGTSFGSIAMDLSKKTNVELTPEVIRRWIRTMEQERGEDPSVLPGHAHHSLTAFENPAA